MEENKKSALEGIYTEEVEGIVRVRNLEKASFRSLLETLPDNIFEYYDLVKQELLSYPSVVDRIYVGKECFFLDTDTIAKFNITDGKLYFYVKFNPQEEGKSKHFKKPLHFVNKDLVYTRLELNNASSCKRARNIISQMMAKYALGSGIK